MTDLNTGTKYPWRRLWYPRGKGASSSMPSAMLSSWFTRNWLDGLSLQKIDQHQCLIMLGEPGIGKSTVVEELVEKTKERTSDNADEVLFVNLKSVGSEQRFERKLFESQEFQSWKVGSHNLYLFFDSLDECLLRVDTVSQLFLEDIQGYPIDRLFLRIACRTADWPNSLETGLNQLWNDNDKLGIFELAPLHREDIVAAASHNGIAHESFFTEINRASAMPFAMKPITLRFLLNIYKRDQSLPHSQQEIYEEGCLILCVEEVEERQRYNNLSSDERIKLASRIAYLTIFGNRFAIWNASDTGDMAEEDISIDELCTDDITTAHVREVLNTGLFTSRGPRRFGWAHQIYAEFLAAHYATQNLSTEQIIALVTAPDGRLAPQLNETAAWLASMNIDLFRRFMRHDPHILLQSDVTDVSDGDKEILVETFLKLFEADELLDDFARISYDKLMHPALAEQLRPYITNPDQGLIVRRVAIDIAEACHCQELQEDLLAVVLNSQEFYQTRINTAYAIRRIGDTSTKAQLASLLDLAEEEDPSDELRGCVLLALWPNHLTIEQALDEIKPPQRSNFTGAYRSFLYDFPKSLEKNDLVPALEWIKQNFPDDGQPIEVLEHPFEDFFKDILWRAWEFLDYPDILTPFAEAAVVRVRNYNPVIGSRYDLGYTINDENRYPTFDQLAQKHPARRKHLIVAMLHLMVHQNIDVMMLIYRARLINEDDLLWLLSKRKTEESLDRKKAYVELISRILRYQREDHVLALYQACEQHEEMKQDFSSILGPVELNSSEADRMREIYQTQLDFASQVEQHKQHQQERSPIDPSPAERVRNFLEQCEAGDSKKWWEIAYWLVPSENGACPFETGSDYDYDIRRTKQWKNLTNTELQRIIEAGKTYLIEQKPEPADWIEDDAKYHRPVLAGYKALWLLMVEQPEAIPELPRDVWTKWGEVIVGYDEYAGRRRGLDDDNWREIQKLLVGITYQQAPEIVVNSLNRIIDKTSQGDHATYLLWEFEHCWDEHFAQAMAQKLKSDDLNFDCYHELLQELLQHNSQEAITIALDAVTQSLDSEETRKKTEISAHLLLIHAPNNSWDAVWQVFHSENELARNVITRLAGGENRHRPIPSLNLTLEQLKELFIWLESNFPRSEDPVHDGPGMYHVTPSSLSERRAKGQHCRPNNTSLAADFGKSSSKRHVSWAKLPQIIGCRCAKATLSLTTKCAYVSN